MTAAYIAVGLGVALLVWTVFVYNALVAGRSRVNEAWSGVDVQLKRRHDLVPSLAETVRAYAAHETLILGALTEARESAMESGGRRGRQAAEQDLSRALVEVRVVSERYPELRAADQYRRLQAQLGEIEGEIQYARRIYNSNLERYNAYVRSFPGALLARPGGFRARGYFDLAPVGLQASNTRDSSGRASESSAAAA
jgi:LemA protein